MSTVHMGALVQLVRRWTEKGFVLPTVWDDIASCVSFKLPTGVPAPTPVASLSSSHPTPHTRSHTSSRSPSHSASHHQQDPQTTLTEESKWSPLGLKSLTLPTCGQVVHFQRKQSLFGQMSRQPNPGIPDMFVFLTPKIVILGELTT